MLGPGNVLIDSHYRVSRMYTRQLTGRQWTWSIIKGGVDATFDTAIYNGLISKRDDDTMVLVSANCGLQLRGSAADGSGQIHEECL